MGIFVARENPFIKLTPTLIPEYDPGPTDKDIKSNLLDKIIASINFEAPFSLTTDYLHKFSIGDNINITNEFGDLNIKQCIVEYIDSLDIEDKPTIINKTLQLYNNFS